jgi:hypothetical protein
MRKLFKNIKLKTVAIIMNNKVYNNIYKKLLYDIRNNKKLSIENIDFIKSISKDELVEIILIYDKLIEFNKKLVDELLHVNSYK